MSLLNQIIAAVFAVLIGLVSGTIYIMSDSSKSMLLNQLESHSNDTATHLGLYMAPYIAEQDAAGIETIVNAIFDSGYYEKIQVTNIDDEDLFTALRSPEISDEVPNWFVKLIAFDTPNIRIEVTHSWAKVGFIVVKSRAGYAYEKLWQGTQTTLIWFITLSLICVVFLSTLIRIILRPLHAIEDQANALSNRQYIKISKIPKTKELRSVVITMNSMIARVQTMFDEQSKNIEELRRTAYIDDITGLANSRAISAQLSDKLDFRDDEGPCSLIYLRVHDIEDLQQSIGQQQADNFIRELADKLQNIANKYIGSIIGRASDSDLVLLIPSPNEGIIKNEVNELIEQYQTTLTTYHILDAQSSVLNLAVVFSKEDTTAAQIIDIATKALSEAADTEQVCVYKTLSPNSQETDSDSWSKHVISTITDKKLYLQYQAIINIKTEKVDQKELLVRILSQSGEPTAAVKFISIVQEQGLITTLDKAVIEHAIAYLNNHLESEPIAVNVSFETLLAADFERWISTTIKGKALDNKLSIEVNESSILSNIDKTVAVKQRLQLHNIGFGVDNFGAHPKGFNYLYKLHPNYIKIDGSLCKEINDNAEDRFFLASLVTAASSLGIPCYAERIEDNSQIEQLGKLGIIATQGFIHGQPKNLES
jgi:EAL domain-containing protein (putative c-di-GMP-specific phosphodiesterase class I)/GGDEF domain-containing protein